MGTPRQQRKTLINYERFKNCNLHKNIYLIYNYSQAGLENSGLNIARQQLDEAELLLCSED